MVVVVVVVLLLLLMLVGRREITCSNAVRPQVYRLEPGFLIQGKLVARGVRLPRTTAKAAKVMERGEVGWAGGSAGPDFFIYLGDAAATWLGAPHDGTVWAELADEASMQTAKRISLLPVPR